MSGAQLHAVTLLVEDYDVGIAWFRDCLRFDLIEDTALGGGKRWVLMRPSGGGPALLLAQPKGDEKSALGRQAGGRVIGFLATDDFDRDHAHMIAAGVHFDEAPRDEPYGRVAVFRDVSGNPWDLIQHRNRG